MIRQTLLGSLLASALVLAACDRKPTDPPTPVADSSAVPAAPVPDTSLPAASAALNAPDGQADTSASGAISPAPMASAAESAAMPLPGQANDHSAPKAGEPGASAAR